MRYEVWLDDYFEIVQAGNPWQACMIALEHCIDERCTFPIAPFLVTNLLTDKEELIGMETIIRLRAVAAESLPEDELQAA